ncbi:uncharacterized protein LOC128274042 [Anopheles cruzii]|uniref:uncharacterized protein LOC128274042 n=1 Tax=Anopheles cruzii TaxID=68878 RepID=UPI0022EC2F37|nr:uncharacterized protein LOC128274042 [Anopheles cruzii]
MKATNGFIYDGVMFLLLVYGANVFINPVAGSSLTVCEGGQTCLPPKECCTQGCCYLYVPPGAPRVPVATADNILNIFFLNHWYFWCFILAIALALLCACSLWKRRRQLCGWGTSGRHSQSEGDSAGSCYAPPQYSRCNSLHIHAPPPYTEVASKPDLYPLVFSYADTGKGNGANYLMVQYFRNYIVQPVESISGTSTVDSLSSSFICTANEANTLVPPPYSRAASPDQSISIRNGPMPRSASQQVYAAHESSGSSHLPLVRTNCQRFGETMFEKQRTLSGDRTGTVQVNSSSSCNNVSHMEPNIHRAAHCRYASIDLLNSMETNAPSGIGVSLDAPNTIAWSCTRVKQIKPISSCPASHADSSGTNDARGVSTARYGSCLDNATESYAQNNMKSNLIQRNSMVCKLCSSTGDMSGSVSEDMLGQVQKNCVALRKSLETCCNGMAYKHTIVQQRKQKHPLQQKTLYSFSGNSADSFMNVDSREKIDVRARNSCIDSSTGSNVSSLLNIDSPHSPPRATSPTAEVRELLEQIRQLHDDREEHGQGQHNAGDVHGAIAPSVDNGGVTCISPPLKPTLRRPSSLIGRRGKLFSKPLVHCTPTASAGNSRAMYMPVAATANASLATRYSLRSPISMSTVASNFLHRGRTRYSWLSKSAPATPGTTGPGSMVGGSLGDNKPLLLNEQDEDGEHNV